MKNFQMNRRFEINATIFFSFSPMPIVLQHVQEHQILKVPPKVPVRQRSQIQVFEVRLHFEEKVPRESSHVE